MPLFSIGTCYLSHCRETLRIVLAVTLFTDWGAPPVLSPHLLWNSDGNPAGHSAYYQE